MSFLTSRQFARGTIREAFQALLNALVLLWILGLALAVMFGRGKAYIEETRGTIERILWWPVLEVWRLLRRIARCSERS